MAKNRPVERLSRVPRRTIRKPTEKTQTNGQAETGPDLSHILESLRVHAVRCDSLQFDPRNAKDHPEENVAVLRSSLKVYGQRRLIVVNKRTGIVEAGNCLLQAALSLGYEWIAAVFVDDDDATARGYAITDNRSSELGDWNTDNYAANLEDIYVGADDVLDQMLADLSKDQGLFSTDEPDLKPLDTKPPPAMTWVLVGIPTVRFGEIAGDVERLAALPDLICEMTSNDGPKDR